MTTEDVFECERCGLRLVNPVRPVYCLCPQEPPKPCKHFGRFIERVKCRACGDRQVDIDIHECGVHGTCTQGHAQDHRVAMRCSICRTAGEGYEIKR